MHLQDLRIVLRDLGLLVTTVGVMAVASIPVALYFGESFALWPLVLTALVSLGLWAICYLPFRNAGEAELEHGLITAGVGWLLVSALGSLPFYLISLRLGGGELYPYADFASAFFETMSGFTTCGLSMALRPDLLPRVLQWWRSFTQWVGGMGVIVLMITLLAGPGVTAVNLYFGEARSEKIHPSVVSTVRTMWWIYALYTLIVTVAYVVTGLPPWDALNHAMAGVATGGFSLWPDSIGHYHSLPVEIVAMFAMVAGGMNFVVHYNLLQKGPRILWQDIQTRWFFSSLVFGTLLLGLILGFSPASFRLSSFQFVAAMTTTGFQAVDLSRWTEATKLFLTIGMVAGACAGGSGGGLKAIRLVTLAKGTAWQLRRLIGPRDAVIPLRLGETSLYEEQGNRRIAEAATFLFLWIVFLILGTLILSFLLPLGRFSLTDVLFEVASAQSNVGLSVGITHPGLPALAKWVLSFHMWIGRLEIIPVLILLRTMLIRRE